MNAQTLLQQLGAVNVVAEYNGGHDEGHIEKMYLIMPDGSHKDIVQVEQDFIFDSVRQKWRVASSNTPQIREEQNLWDMLEQALSAEHGSFAGEYSVDGTITVVGNDIVVTSNYQEDPPSDSYSEE